MHIITITSYQLDEKYLSKDTSIACHGGGKCSAPSFTPYQLDYKNLDNEDNLKLQHPLLCDFINADAHREYIKELLSLLKEVPIIAKDAFCPLNENPSSSQSNHTTQSNSMINVRSTLYTLSKNMFKINGLKGFTTLQ